MRILMILRAESGRRRSPSLDQVIEAYYLLRDSGTEVAIASSQGTNPRFGGGREGSTQASASIRRFQSDHSARDAINDTLKVEQIYPEDFDGAICIDILDEPAHSADAEIVLSLLKEFLAAGKPVAVVPCELELAPQGLFEGLFITGDEVRAPTLAASAILAAINQLSG
jgi:hypothetical protein